MKATGRRTKERHLLATGITALASDLARGIDSLTLRPCAARKRSEIDHAARGRPGEGVPSYVIGQIGISDHFAAIVNAEERN